MIFIRGLEITLQHAVQLTRPATLMEAYESACKAHLAPAPPWKAYIEKTRHEDVEKLKTAMHGELEAFSHQAGNFITRSHSEFIRQQEEKYPAGVKTPPTEGSSAWAISQPEEEVFYGPTLQRLPAPPPPPSSSSWNFQHRTAPVQRNTTPQRPPSPESTDEPAYRGFNSRGNDGGPRGYRGRYIRGRVYGSRGYANRGYGGRGYDDRDQDYPRNREDSTDDREPRGRGYAGRSFGNRQNGRGYNRGYGRGHSYGYQDASGSRDSSVEPVGLMNGALEHEGRPPFRYNSRGSTPQRRDSSAVRVTCWHCGQRGHYSTDCRNPPTDRKHEPLAGPSTTMGHTLTTAQPAAPHPKAGETGH